MPPSPTVLRTTATQVVATTKTAVRVVSVARQGPPGPRGERGERGPVGDPEGALLVTNKLAELAVDAATQEAAQANIGLGVVDPLAYYLLAKA